MQKSWGETRGPGPSCGPVGKDLAVWRGSFSLGTGETTSLCAHLWRANSSEKATEFCISGAMPPHVDAASMLARLNSMFRLIPSPR